MSRFRDAVKQMIKDEFSTVERCRDMAPGDLVVTPTGLRYNGKRYPCAIGRGGLSSRKTEGDGATPVGIHRIVALLYRPDRMKKPAKWALPILPGDLWSDDPAMPDYNNQVKRPYEGSHEIMRRADPLYDLVLVIDWNWPKAESGRGSCIFMHGWRGSCHPTAGCIALKPEHLRLLAAHVGIGCRLIVARGI